MRKRHKEKHHEEHMDETWLIPYADLLTLLLALFIVLFASSQVDAKKLGDMGQVFNAIFSGNVGMLNQSSTINSEMPNKSNPSSAFEELMKSPDASIEAVQLLRLQEEIERYITQNDLSADLSSTLTEDGLLITIGEVALFPSGSADILPAAHKIVTEIAVLLQAYPQTVTVAGHTDNVPINTAEFPSNWDLSSKRALNFMKLLLVNPNLQPKKFNATGYGEFHPVTSNDSVYGKQKNRRVEVLIRRTHK